MKNTHTALFMIQTFWGFFPDAAGRGAPLKENDAEGCIVRDARPCIVEVLGRDTMSR